MFFSQAAGTPKSPRAFFAVLSTRHDQGDPELMMTTQMSVETHVTMMKQVLQGFEQEEVAARSSWDTAEKRAVVPTGWRERTYDIKLLYGVPEVHTRVCAGVLCFCAQGGWTP